MLYCPQCDAEYKDDRRICSEDGATLLARDAWEAERARQGRKPLEIRRLAAVATLQDQFKAEEIAEELAAEGFAVSVVTTKGSMTGSLESPAPTAWQIVVAESEAERAAALVAEWTEEMAKGAADAEKAAEEEEAAAEAP